MLNRKSPLLRYGIAVLTTQLALLLTMWLGPFSLAPFALFHIPVLVSAWTGGWGPALLSILLSALSGAYILLPPAYSLAIGLRGIVQTSIFVTIALLVTLLITSRNRAREQARESHRVLESHVENSPLAVIEWGRDFRVKRWSDRAEKVFGWKAEEVLGKHPDDWRFVFDEDKQAVGALMARLVVGESRNISANRNYRKDGAIVYCEWYNSVLSDEAGNVLSILSLVQDVTERKRSEEALRASEERYRLLFESNPSPMWVYDLETLAFLAVNEAAVHHYGYSKEEFLGMTIKDIRPAEDVARLLDAVARPGRSLGDAGVWRHIKKDGTVIDVLITSHMVSFAGREAVIVLPNDITERRDLEEQLRQAQKMEAVGRLAGGIAHDFNNLLTAIIGYSELLLQRLKADGSLAGFVKEILKASERAGSLTHQLLAFSRKQVLQPRLLDLNETVADMDRMLRRLIGEDIELNTVLRPGIGNVLADPGQVEQIIMNLAVNARDAMPEGGKLTIETAGVFLSEDYTRDHLDVEPGAYVMLAVSDTGCGMDRATQARIFEPFFTTKDKSKGTGLGLSTVYGITKQSGGHIWVYSEPDQGSTFKIYLPVAEGSAGRVQTQEIPARFTTGSETILLVEDEEAVRKLTCAVLQMNGYTVLEAESSEEAIEIAEHYQARIELLLTDVVLPQISGKSLANTIGLTRPDIKVLYISGYTDEAIANHGVLEPGTAFLQKPFTPNALANKVREVLDARG